MHRALGGSRADFFPADRAATVSFPGYVEAVGIAFLKANGDGKVDIAVGTRAGDVS